MEHKKVMLTVYAFLLSRPLDALLTSTAIASTSQAIDMAGMFITNAVLQLYDYRRK